MKERERQEGRNKCGGGRGVRENREKEINNKERKYCVPLKRNKLALRFSRPNRIFLLLSSGA